MIGPLLGGIVVDGFSIQVLFVLISILLLLAIPLARIYDRPLLKEHQNDNLNNVQ